MLAIPPRASIGPDGPHAPERRLARRLPSRAAHIATEEVSSPSCACSSLTLVSADDCNRPNCQRSATQEFLRRRPTACSSRRHHRPVQTASSAARPGRLFGRPHQRGLTHSSKPNGRGQMVPALFFEEKSRHAISSHFDKMGKNDRARSLRSVGEGPDACGGGGAPRQACRHGPQVGAIMSHPERLRRLLRRPCRDRPA